MSVPTGAAAAQPPQLPPRMAPQLPPRMAPQPSAAVQAPAAAQPSAAVQAAATAQLPQPGPTPPPSTPAPVQAPAAFVAAPPPATSVPPSAVPASTLSAPAPGLAANQYFLEQATESNAKLEAALAATRAELAAERAKNRTDQSRFVDRRLAQVEEEERYASREAERRSEEEQARIDKLEEELRYAGPGYVAPGYAAPGYAAPGYAAPGYAATASSIAAAADQTDWWFYGIVIVLIGVAIWWMWSSGLLSNLFKGVNDVVKDATSAVQGAFGFGSSILSTGAGAATAVASDVTHPIGTAVHIGDAIGSEATHIGNSIGHIF